MTLILAALVLAAAQTAPAAPAHQGHHAGHEQKAGQHDCKECCKKMAGKDGKMECMKDEEKKPADGKGQGAHAGHAGHSGH